MIFAFFVSVCECVHTVRECEVAYLKLYYMYNINNKTEGRKQRFKMGTHTHSHAQLLEGDDGKR